MTKHITFEVPVRRENEMEEEMKEIWFPAKNYGFGWGLPIKWQGWVVLLAYVLLITIGSVILSNSSKASIWLLPYILFLTILLILICWKKGEKAEWRWGNKK
jgi:lipoprotein signal peptidase